MLHRCPRLVISATYIALPNVLHWRMRQVALGIALSRTILWFSGIKTPGASVDLKRRDPVHHILKFKTALPRKGWQPRGQVAAHKIVRCEQLDGVLY